MDMTTESVSARLHATAAPDAPAPMISTSTGSFMPVTDPHGASLDWRGKLPNCQQPPDADRAHFCRRPLAGARATVAPYPKGAVMKCLLEFLNDEAW